MSTLPNGLTEDTMYNPRLQACRLNINTWAGYLSSCPQTAGGSFLDLAYGFNYGAGDNGNVVSVSSFGGQTFNRTYSYDSLNRLQSMSAPGDACSGLSWTIDPWGNRTDQTVTGGTCNTFHQTVGTNNQLIGSPYQYDAAGNMTHDASHSYTYDADGHLTQVDGGSTASYYYDALGRRVQKTTGGAATEYIYDTTGTLEAEYCGASCWQTGYVYVNGQLKAQYKNNTTCFVHPDVLGSTRLLSGYPTPSIIDCDDYYPFGELIPGGGTTTITHKFTGKERDAESELDHFLFRNLSSAMGRFISPDPINLTIKRVVNPANTLNKYIYGGNNPLRYVDPTGRDITVFYRAPSRDFGHVLLAVTNQATGAVRFADYYPKGGKQTFGPAAGEMNQNETSDRLKQMAALTIQTTPEVAQKLIDAIDAISPPNATPSYWLPTSNCTTVCTDLLNLAGIDVSSTLQTPTDVWSFLYGNYSAEALEGGQLHMGLYRYQPGRDFGSPMSVFPPGTHTFYNLQLIDLLLRQQGSEGSSQSCVTVTDSLSGTTKTVCE